MDFEFLRPHLLTVAIAVIGLITVFVAYRYFFGSKSSAAEAPEVEYQPGPDEVHGSDINNS